MFKKGIKPEYNHQSRTNKLRRCAALSSAARLLIDNNKICTNDLILTELIPSMIHKKENNLIDLINSIYKYEVHINWDELKQFQIKNLQNGNNNVPMTDLIIAQNCIKNDLIIVTQDKHFTLMAKYLPITIFDQ